MSMLVKLREGLLINSYKKDSCLKRNLHNFLVKETMSAMYYGYKRQNTSRAERKKIQDRTILKHKIELHWLNEIAYPIGVKMLE